MNCEMQETRSKILQLLKTRADMTTNELAEALGISTMGVRQHLDILKKEGLIDYTRRKPERGRPMHIYHLTEKANRLFPTAYANFAVDLLHEMETQGGSEVVSGVLHNRFKSQLETYKQRFAGKNLKERVKNLAQIRDEEGYMAEVTEDSEEFILVEYNCPISTVAAKYPHICEKEIALFCESLGTKVVREHHLLSGSHKCSYRIAKKAETDESST